LGGAELGDKTLLDAFYPAVESMRISCEEETPLPQALANAGDTALQAAQDTRNLVPQKGRASRLGERAVGYQDAGATSIALILQSIARSVADL